MTHSDTLYCSFSLPIRLRGIGPPCASCLPFAKCSYSHGNLVDAGHMHNIYWLFFRIFHWEVPTKGEFLTWFLKSKCTIHGQSVPKENKKKTKYVQHISNIVNKTANLTCFVKNVWEATWGAPKRTEENVYYMFIEIYWKFPKMKCCMLLE